MLILFRAALPEGLLFGIFLGGQVVGWSPAPSSFLASPVAGWLGSVEIQNFKSLRDRMLYLDMFILRDISQC